MLGVLSRLKERFSGVYGRNIAIFAAEGLFLAMINALIYNNNTLFASRLGASDFQLSLNFMLTQAAGMIFLLPGGLIADRLKNKRRMVTGALICCSALYILIGILTMREIGRLNYYLVLYAVSTGSMTIYTASWQSFFSDVTPSGMRNRSLSLRQRVSFVVGITLPLITGFILAAFPLLEDKIRIHQYFFFAAAGMFIIQIFLLSNISAPENTIKPKTSVKELLLSFSSVIKNKPYLKFVFVAVFLFASWQMDWSLFFILQTRYLESNEVWLSYANIGTAVAQFLSVGVWSRLNEKYGVRFTLIFAAIGNALAPVSVFVSTALAPEYGRFAYLILASIFGSSIAAVMLNIPQCLLQVVDEKNKTLSISVYSMLIALSNAVMPMAGTSVYSALGGGLDGMRYTYIIIMAVRITAAVLVYWRWKTTQHLEK